MPDSTLSLTISADLAQAIEDAGHPVPAVLAWSDRTGQHVCEFDRPTREAFEEAFAGDWPSESAFAQSLADDLGLIPDDAPWPLSCINWAVAANELFWGSGDYWASDSATGCYVFRTL